MTDRIEQAAPDVRELIERLEKRAKTYSWDSTTFYASDADLMLRAAASLRAKGPGHE